MKNKMAFVAAFGLFVGGFSSVSAAPTDPSNSGTMDVANDRDDTSADVNAGRVPKEDNASTHQKAMRARANRKSPKIDPSQPGPKVESSHPAAGNSLNTGVAPDAVKGMDPAAAAAGATSPASTTTTRTSSPY